MRAALRVERALPSAALFLGIATAVLLAACGGGGDMGMGMSAPTSASCMMNNMSGCMAPTVTMQSPGTSVHLTVTLKATATSMMMSDMVMRVDFMVDGTVVGTALRSPYSVAWDTTSVADGPHTLTASVMDSMDQTATSPPVSVAVDNNPTLEVAMSAAQVLPAPASGATGSASLSVKLASGAVSGTVRLSGVTATAVSLNEAFAGDSGPALISLAAGGSGQWGVPAGAMLTADQVTALLQGRLYLLASSAANPGGEIRGQVTPANIMVSFSPMSGMQEVPPVSIAASGTVATTVDGSAGTLTVHVHSSGIDDAMAGSVDSGAPGATGAKLVTLAKDAVDPGHWSMELAPVTAGDLANFMANMWYANLATPIQPGGAIRGQIEAPAH